MIHRRDAETQSKKTKIKSESAEVAEVIWLSRAASVA
jgi:hypothetical protein